MGFTVWPQWPPASRTPFDTQEDPMSFSPARRRLTAMLADLTAYINSHPHGDQIASRLIDYKEDGDPAIINDLTLANVLHHMRWANDRPGLGDETIWDSVSGQEGYPCDEPSKMGAYAWQALWDMGILDGLGV